MIFTPAATRSVGHLLGIVGRHREHADHDVLLLDHRLEVVQVADGEVAHRSPTSAGSTSKMATIRKPWSAKMSELAIALPRLPAPKSAMLCWPAVRRILRICETSESTL